MTDGKTVEVETDLSETDEGEADGSKTDTVTVNSETDCGKSKGGEAEG